MAFDWDNRHPAPEGSSEYFAEVDRRFFQLIEHVAHPGWPKVPPFSSLENFAALTGKKVLEIGCGAGSVAEALARCGADLTAIDLTQRAVDLTRKRLDLAGLPANVLKMDAEEMNFPDASFDYIWSWGVIHHARKPERIVREMYRILRPGGCFAVMLYHRRSTRFWISGVLRRGVLGLQLLKKSPDDIQMEFTDGFHARHYSVPDARELFSGFEVAEIRILDMNDLAIPFHPLRKFLRPVGSEKVLGPCPRHRIPLRLVFVH